MKRNPYRAAFGAMFVALVVACAPGKTPAVTGEAAVTSTPQATLDAAMQADRDFAAMAKAQGPQAAFQAFMHVTDSKFIQPGVVVEGADAIAGGFAQSPPGFAADWTPDGGHGAASGDLAVTTGLYRLSISDQTIEQGRYVTVWSRDAAGEFKAAMDLSVPDPVAAPTTAPEAPEAPDAEGRPG
ncbi:MAG: hypothetical protein SGJ21_00850 [Alphaproteobacteria bacterium]|mgnify:CR=1 FL=1|nr:hypothetical protein [Alphaproteobacteria bacterium]